MEPSKIRPPSSFEGRIRFALLLALFAIAGCAAPIGVERIGALKAQREFSHDVLSTGELSGDAKILLRRTNLIEVWNDEPATALEDLYSRLLVPTDEFTSELRASFLDDVAELAFAHASESNDHRYFLVASLYCWLYLFPAEDEPKPRPLSRATRKCADIYNRGLTLALTDPDSGEVQIRGGEFPLPFGALVVELDEASLAWGDRRFTRFSSLADLSVRGIINRYRIPGLGAPLAGEISSPIAKAGEAEKEDLIFSGVRAPVTALLEFENASASLASGELNARLSIIPYADADSTEIEGQRIRLESEPSAALALQLTEVPPWKRELQGFFQGDLAMGRPGIVSLAPYQRGRIPLVLVHGTASSAGRWADLLNDLQSDTVLRSQFQFWLFTYNTGNPIAYSGWLLRKAIANLVEELDPDSKDPALRDMVVMGHSQGGLLTKLLVVDSGESFWDAAIDRPRDEIELEPENRELLEGSLIVEPSPYVDRVIFLSTPHHGSRLANFGLARFFGRMIRAPANIVDATRDVFKDDPEKEVQRRIDRGTGSVGNMSPDNHFIQALAALPIAPGVHAHSIMGVRKGPKEEGGDGVVSYESAHLDDVESELVVQSGHSSQSNPLVVSEVHRILLDHLRAAIDDGVVEAFDQAFEEPIEALQPLDPEVAEP